MNQKRLDVILGIRFTQPQADDVDFVGLAPRDGQADRRQALGHAVVLEKLNHGVEGGAAAGDRPNQHVACHLDVAEVLAERIQNFYIAQGGYRQHLVGIRELGTLQQDRCGYRAAAQTLQFVPPASTSASGRVDGTSTTGKDLAHVQDALAAPEGSAGWPKV